MKKHLHNSLRALFLSLAVLLSLPMLAEQVEIGGINYDLNAETNQATVIEKSSGKYFDEVVIPKSVEYGGTAYSVTSIGKWAFRYCRDLTSVTIPNSVTSIVEYAFYYCDGLTSVTIGNSVESIGDYAFRGCSGLTSVTIPNSVASIGAEAFGDCSGLTSIVVEEGNTVYDSRNNCNAIIETASNTLHFGCKTTIIPNSVESIGDKAFCDCSGLTSVTIPNSVTSIGSSAFEECDGLTSVTIGNSVTSIGSYAFFGCSGLTSVTIPNSVKSIESDAFGICSELTDVYCYAEEVPTTDSYAFEDWYIRTATLHVPAGSVDSYKATVPWKDFGSIVALPPFSGEVEIDGINYELNGETMQAAVIKKSSGEYSGKVVIPESVEHEGTAYSVKSIGDFAFSDCSGLTSVTIPNSVLSIGVGAFNACSGLTSVTIPNSVLSIEMGAFAACSGLTSVTIPNSVTSIGDGAFYGCSGLPSVTIPNSVTSIGDDAFSGCSGLTSVTIGNSVTSIGKRTFYGCSGLTSVSIPNSVTSVGEEAFSWCESLTSVTIPNSVTSIGEYAFCGCKGLTSVTIPNSVESIGMCAFNACSGLTSVTIGNSVTSIEMGAFSGCSGLTSVTIPNSVTSIGSHAFDGCSGLTSLTIPNSVTSIGRCAFSGCSGLTSVTIGNSVESIGDFAFQSCSKLHDVYCYAENVPSTESNAFEDSPIQNATLHVPAASVESYKTAPWNGFGTITPLPNLSLTDGEEFENNTEQTFSTLTYTRTLPNMLWNPLYVPFKIPYEALEENYEVAYINAMHSYDNDDNGEIDEMVMEIVKIKAGTLKPNHPYLIKAKNDEAMEMSIVQENATLYPAEITTLDCSSVYTKFEITGTYQEMTSEDLNGSLVISTDGAWKLLSSTSILKPFRFYLTISSREGSPVEIAEEAMSSVRIRVMGESDNATGIDETENTENSVVFDLYGRRVSTPAKGGVYIINGKKVIY